ncbi:MAG: FAD-dependent oxidoreductase [Candidatus Hydrogenedens sp.]|nr:FAD-dependent oxidoreductase [Candidatus Hydrogenedens sp.]
MRLKLDERPFATVPPAVSPDGAYQPVSFWQETIDVAPGAPLQEHLQCDVCVIGGGYSGLSVARELKQRKPDLDIVVLERGVCGHGASGRNGGFSMPLIGWDLYETAKSLGDEKAKRTYELMYDAVDYFKRLIADNAIACDLESTGYLFINTCEAREKHSRHELAKAQQLGFDHRWLDRAELQDYIRSDRYRSAIFDPHPCIVNPAKLARGLKDAAERQGIRIYEQTSVTGLTDGDPVSITTEHGSVKARQVALCLNGFGASLGFFKHAVLPIHTYIVLTEPLTDAQLEAIGWAKHRASLETARNFIHYFRLTADNRIAFGGEDADLYPGGVYRNLDETIAAALRQRFREHFPSLADVRFTHAWGGTLGVSLDMFPVFGQGGDHGSIFHACAYAGHGVSLSNYCGTILAPMMLRAAGHTDVPEPAQLPFFWNKKPLPMPPDPFRYWGLRVYRQALKAQDWWQGA